MINMSDSERNSKLPAIVVVLLFILVSIIMFGALWSWYRFAQSELGPHVVVAEPLVVRYIDEKDHQNQSRTDSIEKNKGGEGNQKKCAEAQKIEYTFLVKEVLFGNYGQNDFSFELSLTSSCSPRWEINFTTGQKYLMVFDRPSAGIYRLMSAAPVKQNCELPSEDVLTDFPMLVTLQATGLAVGKVCVFSSKSKRLYEQGIKLDLLKKHLDLLGAMQPQQYLSNIFKFDLKQEEESDAESASG